jgi:hypothetical protein
LVFIQTMPGFYPNRRGCRIDSLTNIRD